MRFILAEVLRGYGAKHGTAPHPHPVSDLDAGGIGGAVIRGEFNPVDGVGPFGQFIEHICLVAAEIRRSNAGTEILGGHRGHPPR